MVADAEQLLAEVRSMVAATTGADSQEARVSLLALVVRCERSLEAMRDAHRRSEEWDAAVAHELRSGGVA
jgi:hypothetical protein